MHGIYQNWLLSLKDLELIGVNCENLFSPLNNTKKIWVFLMWQQGVKRDKRGAKATFVIIVWSSRPTYHNDGSTELLTRNSRTSTLSLAFVADLTWKRGPKVVQAKARSKRFQKALNYCAKCPYFIHKLFHYFLLFWVKNHRKPFL